MTTREEAALVLYRSLERVVSEMPRLVEMATQEERAAVVAWLRAEADAPHPIEAGERALSPSGRGLLLLAADRIERGEHCREEKNE